MALREEHPTSARSWEDLPVTRVLLVTASRHGSTRELAGRIRSTLRREGIDAQMHDAHSAPAPVDFDAVILGSAIYMGAWMADMKSYIDANEASIRARATWIFSSGPLGEPLLPREEPPVGLKMKLRLGARDHIVFAGKLTKDGLSFAERAIVKMVHAEEGDYRDWEKVDQWASSIAASLRHARPAFGSADVTPPPTFLH